MVTKSGFLANARWMWDQAIVTKAFVGGSSTAVKAWQKKALVDILAGLGWNVGRPRLSKSLSEKAWWLHLPDPERQEDTLVGRLNKLYPDTNGLELVKVCREKSKGRYIPCRKNPKDKAHRYHQASKKPFRLRCCEKSCKNNCPAEEVIPWMAEPIRDD